VWLIQPFQRLPLQLTKWTGLARLLPSPLYKLAAQAYIDKEFPRHVFIETTSQCNLSCEYCPREKRSDHMEFNLFKAIVDECSQYGARSFSLHLFGEPLLYPKIMEAINYIKAKNRRHTILLTTNGTVLNKFAKRLLESGVDRIIWSWRSLTTEFSSETIEVLKRIGMVRLLIEETPKEEFEKWSKFPRVEIKHLHNYGGNIDVSNFGSLESLQGEKRYPCYHLWLAPAIRWNGEIVECCNIPKAGTYVLGKYPTNTLSSVWRGKELSSLRESHLKGIYPGACAGCNSYKAYPDIFFERQKECNHG